MPKPLLLAALATCAACAHPSPVTPSAPPAPSSAQPAPATPAEAVAAAFVGELARHDWAAAHARFTPRMAKAMPEASVAELWQHLLTTQGEWVGVDRYATEAKGGYAVATMDLRFARRRQWLRLTIEAGGRIGGVYRGPIREDTEREARAIVEALARGDGERAASAFDATMRAKLPAAGLVADWNAVVADAGPFEGVTAIKLEPRGPHPLVAVECRMRSRGFVVRTAFDADGDVAGLFLQPAYEPPPYADASALEERDVTVGSAPALPGTLTLPRGARAVPGVVLVHGSGPNERDEPLGATLVFRDLARGLATRGIAVLRYDKRTRVDPRGVVTQKEEVVDGALAAIDLLRRQPEVDPARVVVAGHSQGGSLAPRIAIADKRLAGIAVLAGGTRTLQDAMLAQTTYLSSLDPGNAPRRQAIDAAIAFKKAVEDPALKPDSEVPGGGGARGAYFLDMRGYHPEEVAAKLPCAVVAVQGGRDYQVTLAEDFVAWQRALAGNSQATLKVYPALDHRLVAGEGRSSPAQYEQPGHVDAQLVSDLAAWVTGLAPATAAP
jgi:dienelactone hydrolase